MRNRALAAFIVLVLVSLFPRPAAQARAPEISGRAALLMDGETGQVLWKRSASDVLYPASTTKVLTALVALERGRLDQVITIGPEVTTVQGWDSSSCYLRQGEQLPLESLLLGLMLSSGNDCAVAIAVGLTGGNPELFARWMNEKAREVGATRSNFVNPSGLHHPNHFSTAHDLGLILKAALENPDLVRIMRTESYVLPGHEADGVHWNQNRLLFTYPGTIAGKTGFTEEAGSTLVAAGRRNDMLLIGVVLGNRIAAETYRDTIALLDYGFDQFRKADLIAAGEPAGVVPVLQGEKGMLTAITAERFQVLVSASSNSLPAVSRQISLPPEIQAPVQPGQPLGTLVFTQEGLVLGSVALVAAEAIEARQTTWSRVEPYLNRSGDWLKWLLYGVAGFLLFRTAVLLVRRFLFRRPVRRAPPRRKNAGAISAYRTKQR
jgi:serine-type D-Ala-D-Ala carboxypeptidase (penicillin-binding protein 5/6)